MLETYIWNNSKAIHILKHEGGTPRLAVTGLSDNRRVHNKDISAATNAYNSTLSAAREGSVQSFLQSSKLVLETTMDGRTSQGYEALHVQVKECSDPCYALVFEITRPDSRLTGGQNTCVRVVTAFEFDYLLQAFLHRESMKPKRTGITRKDVIQHLLSNCYLVEEEGRLRLRFTAKP